MPFVSWQLGAIFEQWILAHHTNSMYDVRVCEYTGGQNRIRIKIYILNTRQHKQKTNVIMMWRLLSLSSPILTVGRLLYFMSVSVYWASRSAHLMKKIVWFPVVIVDLFYDSIRFDSIERMNTTAKQRISLITGCAILCLFSYKLNIINTETDIILYVGQTNMKGMEYMCIMYMRYALFLRGLCVREPFFLTVPFSAHR